MTLLRLLDTMPNADIVVSRFRAGRLKPSPSVTALIYSLSQRPKTLLGTSALSAKARTRALSLLGQNLSPFSQSMNLLCSHICLTFGRAGFLRKHIGSHC